MELSESQTRPLLINPQVAAHAKKPDADPFDLLCHLAFNAPALPPARSFPYSQQQTKRACLLDENYRRRPEIRRRAGHR